MDAAGEDLIYVRERKLPYKTFDADNHMYENRDALTKFIPKAYEGVVKYVDVNGRTKLAIKDQLTNYIPNPTFGKVAVPGGYGMDVTKKGDDSVRKPGQATGQKVQAMPGLDAFFDPEPRLALMHDMGIDRTLLWPTLASAIEERLASDPDAGVRRDPRAQPVDARALDVQLRRRHLRDADHLAREPRRRARRARVRE